LFKAYFELGMPVLVRMMMRVLGLGGTKKQKDPSQNPACIARAFKNILGRTARFVHSILLGFMKYKVPSILLAAVQD
jgi:hypothetical protein